MRLADFPNIYPGEKNCFDCKHFKMKVPVRADGLIEYVKGKARCIKGFILRELTGRKGLREPVFSFSNVTWDRIRDGWRHAEWGAANVCDDFEDMGRGGGDSMVIKK